MKESLLIPGTIALVYCIFFLIKYPRQIRNCLLGRYLDNTFCEIAAFLLSWLLYISGAITLIFLVFLMVGLA